MKSLDQTPELLKLAEAVVWFKKPTEALNDPIHFLAHAMSLGTDEDIRILQEAGIGTAEFQEVLEKAPPGIFDPRSWAYWNKKCGRSMVPPLPKRSLNLD